MNDFEEKLKKQNAVAERRMMESGLFKKYTGFYVYGVEIRCRALLSDWELVHVCFEGCYTNLQIHWLYDKSISLSVYHKARGRDEFAHWQDPDLPSRLDEVLSWISDYLNGKYSWRSEYDHPGPATFLAVPLATAIKQAMLDVGETFTEPEQFKKHVLAKVRNGRNWTFAEGKFSCMSADEPPQTVSLVIANPSNLDLKSNKFSSHTIVYAPESVGRYFLHAIDEMHGEREVRTLVDGWLKDLEESEYVPH